MDQFINAVTHKQWPVVAGFVIVFLVHFANKMGLEKKVGSKYVPWIALGLGFLLSAGVALVSGVAVSEVVHNGLLSGGLATGLWELALKDLLSKPGNLQEVEAAAMAALSATTQTVQTPPAPTPPAPPPANS